jgi:carbon storage regulator
MLVLTRKVGEQIVIDDNIVVTIVAIDGNKIRLGIEAPKSVRVDRAEVHLRRLNEEASVSDRELVLA